MINKLIISIIVVIVVIIIGIIYLISRTHGDSNPGGGNINKCGNNILCKTGEYCQSDHISCCKNELWGKDINGYDKCCDNSLCGNICCNKGQNCGLDINNNSICCDSELCGKYCCENGKKCQTDNICCNNDYWGKDKAGIMKCCNKKLCGDICCEDSEECDPDTKKCIKCKTTTCNGICCEQEKTCYTGVTKKICCDSALCGDNCCDENQTCIIKDKNKICCDIPCKNNTECCESGYTCINDTCCKFDIKCVDETGNPVCYNIDQCGKDKNGNCVCCKIGEKFDPITFKCKTYCGELCDINSQYCVKENGEFVGCANKGCIWSSYNYNPPTIIDNGKNIDICSSNNKYYTVNNPTDNNGNIIPLNSLTRSSFVIQDKSSKSDCTLANCKDKIDEVNMQFVDYDSIPKKCSASFDCTKLQSNKNICSLTHIESCCKDIKGNFTGQICPSNRVCYNGNCVCNQGDDEIKDNCIKYDCGPNGVADFSSGTFVCHCDKDFTGIKCQYGKDTTCKTHGDPIYNGSCNCYPGFIGSNCQYSRANCSNSGNPNSNGICTCDNGFLGKKCEYSRNNTCSGHGIVDDNGKCYCDPSFNTTDCSTSNSIDWILVDQGGSGVKYPSTLYGNNTIIVKKPWPEGFSSGIVYYSMNNNGDIHIGNFGYGDDESLGGFLPNSDYILNKTTGTYTNTGWGIPTNAPYMYAGLK